MQDPLSKSVTIHILSLIISGIRNLNILPAAYWIAGSLNDIGGEEGEAKRGSGGDGGGDGGGEEDIKVYEIKDIEICEIGRDCGALGGALDRAEIVISIELDEFERSFCAAFWISFSVFSRSRFSRAFSRAFPFLIYFNSSSQATFSSGVWYFGRIRRAGLSDWG